MAQVTWRASGAKAAGTGAVTPALPTGMSAGDIVILVASTIAEATCSITANGSITTWNAIGTGHQDVTAGEHLYAWWGRWASGTTGPTVTPTSDHCCAGTIAFYNCNQISPIDVNAWSSEATSDTSFSFATGLTSTVATSLAIVICSSGVDSNTGQFSGAFTNASLTSITTRLNFQTSSGLGGGFGMAQGVKATAGAIGTWTETLAGASSKAYVSFVLNPPTDTTLTVDECFHGDTADAAGTLAQVHNLTPAEAFHGHTADGDLVLTQVDTNVTLVVSKAFHALTSDAPALTQQHLLVIADAAHTQSADGATLTQAHLLTVADAAQALTSDTLGVFVQNSTLVVADCAHAQSAESPAIKQVHTLAGVAECRHLQSADAAPVTQVHNLTISDTRHTQAADAVALTQAHTLAAADARHAQTADGAALTQQHVLAVAEAFHAQTADSPAPYEGGGTNTVLTVQRAVHQQTADSPARLTENSVLVVAEAFHSTSSDGALIVTQNFTLVVADARHTHTAEAVTLTQVHQLAAHDARHLQTATGPALVQQHFLTVDDCAHAQHADEVTIPIYFYWLAASRTVLTHKWTDRSCATAHEYASALLTRKAWPCAVLTQLETDKQILTTYEILR